MRRWLVRILIVVLVLAALLLAVVQAVLWSDLPRRMVVDTLQAQTGLDVHLDELSVGWSGATEGRNLRLGAPLADRPALTAPRLRVRHTSVWSLLIGGSLNVESLSAPQPTLHVRRDDSGRWNVQQIVETVRGAARDPEATGPIALPRLDITDASVRVTGRDGREVELSDVSLTGRSAGMAYALKLDLAQAGQVNARFARSMPHAHTVDFDLQPTPTLAEALGLGEKAYEAHGQWRGRIADTGLTGDVKLTSLVLPDAVRVEGAANVAFDNETGALVLRPETLRATPAGDGIGAVALTDGTVKWQQPTLALEDVRAEALDGVARLTGSVNPAARIGEVQADWQRMTFGEGVTHTARAEIAIAREGPALRRLTGTIHTTQLAGVGGTWEGRVEVRARGRSWRDMAGTVTTHDVRVQRGDTAETLPNLSTAFAMEAPVVRIERLTLPESPAGTSVNGSGRYDWRTRDWSARLDVTDFPMPMLIEPFSVLNELEVVAEGTAQSVDLRHARVSSGGIVATATGSRDPARATPVDLQVNLEQAPIDVRDAQRVWIDARNLAGRLHVTGTLAPLKLGAEGELIARELYVHRERVGDLTLPVVASADRARVMVSADSVTLFDGQWSVQGKYVYDSGPDLTISGEGFDLALASGLFGTDLGLTGEGDLEVRTVRPRAGGGPVITGDFTLRDVQRGRQHIEHAEGNLRVADNELRVHEIVAREDGGELTGSLSMALDEPARLRFSTALTNWPIPLAYEPLRIRVDAATKDATPTDREHAWFDVAQRAGQVTLNAGGSVHHDEQQLASLKSRWRVNGSELSVMEMKGKLLGGDVTGVEGHVRFNPAAQHEDDDVNAGDRSWADVLKRSRFKVTWENVEPAQLSPLAPAMAQAEGTVEGSLALAPDDGPRAIGPVRLDLHQKNTGATYRGLEIGEADATAYLDPDRRRYVLHEMSIKAVEGTIEGWGRLTWHAYDERAAVARNHDGATNGAATRPAAAAASNDEIASDRARAGDWYLYANGSVEKIDLEPVTRTLWPQREPIIGQVSASALVNTPVNDWTNAFGRGQLELTQSDLAELPIISLLYDLANVQFGEREPAGTGEARFRVEEGLVIFDRFHYQNRGTQLELFGRVEDIRQGAASPIDGYALVSVQPLPDILFLETINEAFEDIQGDVTTVRLGGTLAEPQHWLVPFAQLQDTISRALGGATYEEPGEDADEDADEDAPNATQPGESGA